MQVVPDSGTDIGLSPTTVEERQDKLPITSQPSLRDLSDLSRLLASGY